MHDKNASLAKIDEDEEFDKDDMTILAERK
jgi:hypothetical protein